MSIVVDIRDILLRIVSANFKQNNSLLMAIISSIRRISKSHVRTFIYLDVLTIYYQE